MPISNSSTPRFGHINPLQSEAQKFTATVSGHLHPSSAHQSFDLFGNAFEGAAKALDSQYHIPPGSQQSQSVLTTSISYPSAPIAQPTHIQAQAQSGLIHQNAYTRLEPTVIQQDAFTALYPKGTAPANATIPTPIVSQTAPIAKALETQVTTQPSTTITPQPTATLTNNPILKNPQLMPDRMHQLVNRIGIKVEDFNHDGYFEKMSSGSVFSRKTLLPTAYAAVPLSFAALGTAIPLVHSASAAAAAGAVFTGTTGAAIGTGAGAAGLGAILAGYLGWAGYRSSKVMKEYKQFLGRIKADLLKPGNENAVRWYLRTISAGSAKKKARKGNAKTLMQLDSVKNPSIMSHPVYKVYMRYGRNQNAVFLTRNPEYARILLAEAERRAAGKENMR